ncbi:hypothetical protein MRO13_16110 [Vibrio metschnikovii]|nr:MULTISPECIES: hypothetical protein [unclassified Vibrio]EKO3678168.1 hypothetical protein [Vibrio metschnikovii]EKO3793743.1 hypothetical protein [Vibrio metschnikovii]EKO3914793.1 hypothetical protein [Vibrio metschnikovii]NNN62438.1 hypothetical protein [Vibrio sp. A11]NNN85696.1 hypothetical protein [Vibrio sp. A8-1]
MSITTLFRVILISGLVTSIVGIIAGFSLSETLPPILQEYLLQAEKKEVSNFEMVFLLVASLALLVLLPVSTVGLWKFKRWARTLYIVISIVFIPLSIFVGPIVMNSWEAMFNEIAILLEGILIAMMFMGPISEKFKHVAVTKTS